MNEHRRNLDTWNDQEDHDGEDYCENCCDWTGDEDGMCAECGLSFHEMRASLDNTASVDDVLSLFRSK